MKFILSFAAFLLLLNVVELFGQHIETDSAAIMGGPESTGELLKLAQNKLSLIPKPKYIESYDKWRRGVREGQGISFAFTSIIAYNTASEVINSTTEGFGGIYRLMFSWELVGRGTGHTGRLDIRAEARNAFPGFLSPSQLGKETGMAALDPAFAYSHNFNLDLPIIAWVQGFNNNRAGIAIGRVGFDAFLDPIAFQTFTRTFMNRSTVFPPTTPTTGIGALGVVAKGFVSSQVWIGGQIYDANAASGTFDINTIKEGEFLSAIEIGYTPSFNRRKTDKIQFSYWFKDARVLAGTSSGNGWLVSSSWSLGERLLSFIRIGSNNGGAGIAATTSVSGGIEFKPQPYHAISLGGGWARPSVETFGNVREEYVVEMSYMIQLFSKFSLMADIQYMGNPTNNPTVDNLWVLAVRNIINF